MHCPASNVSSSRQSAILRNFSSDNNLRSLTLAMVSNLSWSLFLPADLTTVWKMLLSNDHKVTFDVDVIVAVRLQLYKIANSPNRQPDTKLQTVCLSGP